MALTPEEKLATFYMRALKGVQALCQARVGNASSLISAIESYATHMLAEPGDTAVSKVVLDIEAVERARGWARTLIEALEPIAELKTESRDPVDSPVVSLQEET